MSVLFENQYVDIDVEPAGTLTATISGQYQFTLTILSGDPNLKGRADNHLQGAGARPWLRADGVSMFEPMDGSAAAEERASEIRRYSIVHYSTRMI